MPGHRRDGWGAMLIIGTRVGPAGPASEKDMILYCKYTLPEDMHNSGESCMSRCGRCNNKADDSRGLSGTWEVVNFLYVVYDFMR